jgi:hypothetical protein
MNPVPFILIIVTLPLLLGGCGEKPVSEVKPVEEVPLNPNLKYEIKEGTVTITDCDKKASGTITIPATVEGKPVTSIGRMAFAYCGSLSIIIGNGVTSIGISAFYNCKSLTSITIGNSVTSIGEWAFYGCASLTVVTFLGDAPNVGEDIFEDSNPPTIYRKPEAKGWGDTWGGRPVKLISEKP